MGTMLSVDVMDRPDDIYHLGKVLLKSLRRDLNRVIQIDVNTGESETCGSVLKRSVTLACTVKSYGLQVGDVIMLTAPCHLYASIVTYTGLLIGTPIMPVDNKWNIRELKAVMMNIKPNLVFCHSSKLNDISAVVNEMKLDTKIITFDKSEYDINMFIHEYYIQGSDETFRATEFDKETLALIITTSGSTGQPKGVKISHRSIYESAKICTGECPGDDIKHIVQIFSPLQWISAQIANIFCLYYRYTKLQTSATNITAEHFLEAIDKYKTTYTFIGPSLLNKILSSEHLYKCDLSSVRRTLVGSSYVPQKLIQKYKNFASNSVVANGYGMTEVVGYVLLPDTNVTESVGRPIPNCQYKLVNINSGEEVITPLTTGELWVKTPAIFSGYYNDPELNAEVLTSDGWFKTGDLLYKDTNGYYYYVDRIKMMMKYKSYQISPVEVENVIRELKGILDVCVTSVTSEECGDLLVACCIVDDRYTITAQDVKNIVKDNLSEYKQLHGGVVFIESLPLLATLKVDRLKLKQIVTKMKIL